MATHTVSWGGTEDPISPVPSSTPSIVSIDSALSYESNTSSTVREATGPTPVAKLMDFLLVESSGSETSASTQQRADTADESFTRHHKYFFKDGNVTFLVDGTLYCVHRYFFSRDSVYFSTRFDQLGIRDHEVVPITISLSDIERNDLDAFLSILYPENFAQHDFSYEEWKSVLHLSTRWSFASIRMLALNNIQPPTPCDRLILARTYSVDHWVIPALSALCERGPPLSLDEARKMDIEDVVLVATVREDVRAHALQVGTAEITRRVEAAQAGKLVHVDSVGVSPVVPVSGAVGKASSSVDQTRDSKGQDTEEGGGEVPQNRGAPEDIGDCQTEKIARQKAEVENAQRKALEAMQKDVENARLMSAEAKRKEVENARRMEEEAKRKEVENVRRKVEDSIRKADREKMQRWEAEVEREARAAELVAKAKNAKCKADAAECEAAAATVVVLEAVPGLEKAVASEVVCKALSMAKKARREASKWEAEARRMREGSLYYDGTIV